MEAAVTCRNNFEEQIQKWRSITTVESGAGAGFRYALNREEAPADAIPDYFEKYRSHVFLPIVFLICSLL
jgi:hypothetical protein